MNTPDPLDALALALRGLPEREVPFPVRRRTRPIGRVLTPLALATGVAVAVVVLRPVPAYGWDGAVMRSESAPVRRITEYGRNGQIESEYWIAPNRFATWHKLPNRSEASFELRSDGRRSYRFQDPGPRNPRVPPENVRTIGTVRTLRAPLRVAAWDFPPPSLAGFAARNGAAVTEVRVDGEIRYRVRERRATRVQTSATTSEYRQMTYLVRLDGKGRVSETTADGYRTVYGYPDAIAETTFAPRPQTRIVPVVDLDAVRRKADAWMTEGYGIKKGVRLRLVALTADGELHAFWTGHRLDLDARRYARLLGRPDAGSRINPQYTLWAGRKGLPHRTYGGLPVSGQGFGATGPIGTTVDLAIPGRGGDAAFRNVPVLRIATLEGVTSLFEKR